MSHSRTTRIRTLAAALATCAGLAVALAGPSYAQGATRSDPADVGGASLNDLRQVRVDHGEFRVTAKIKVTDLRARSEAGPAGLTVFFDSAPKRKGPERRIDTGLDDGSDFQLTRATNWQQDGDRLTCRHSVSLDFEADVVTVWVARGCLGKPAKVRVAVKMVDLYDGSHPITDWIGNDRSYTPWLAVG